MIFARNFLKGKKMGKNMVFMGKSAISSKIMEENTKKNRGNLLERLKIEKKLEEDQRFSDSSLDKTLKELEIELRDHKYMKSMDLKKDLDDYRLLISFEARNPLKEEAGNLEDKGKKNMFFLIFFVFLVL